MRQSSRVAKERRKRSLLGLSGLKGKALRPSRPSRELAMRQSAKGLRPSRTETRQRVLKRLAPWGVAATVIAVLVLGGYWLLESTDNGPLVEQVAERLNPAALDYDALGFSQPAILRALASGDSTLSSVKPRLPRVTPDFIVEASQAPAIAPEIDAMVVNMYTAQLAITLGARGEEEHQGYLIGSEQLSDFIDADTIDEAHVKLDTGRAWLSRKLAEFGLYGRLIGTLGDAADSAAGGDVVGAIVGAYTEHDERQKRLARFGESFRTQAVHDRNKLHRLYVEGSSEKVIAIYESLRAFVLR